MSLNELSDACRANDWGDADMDTKKAAPLAQHPPHRRSRNQHNSGPKTNFKNKP